METLSVYLPQTSAARLRQTAQSCGLKRATLMRLVLERWLENPVPPFEVPPYQPRKDAAQ